MKKSNLFFYSTLLSIMFFTSTMKAQIVDTANSSTTIKKVKSTDWQLLFSNEFVEINYRYAVCDLPTEGTHKENVYIQIKNKTDKNLKCDWNTEYWYDGICSGCQGSNPEFHKSVMLKPNQTRDGICTTDRDLFVLQIFSKMMNHNIRELTNFDLKDIKVTVLK